MGSLPTAGKACFATRGAGREFFKVTVCPRLAQGARLRSADALLTIRQVLSQQRTSEPFLGMEGSEVSLSHLACSDTVLLCREATTPLTGASACNIADLIIELA